MIDLPEDGQTMLVEALTAIATDFPLDDGIDALNWIYADPENTSDLIKLAFKRVPKHLQRDLGRVFKARQSRIEAEAMGEFKIGDLVMIRFESADCEPDINGEVNSFEICLYPSLKNVVLTIDQIDYPWIVCTRPSGTTAPGLLKNDITKYRLWPH